MIISQRIKLIEEDQKISTFGEKCYVAVFSKIKTFHLRRKLSKTEDVYRTIKQQGIPRGGKKK